MEEGGSKKDHRIELLGQGGGGAGNFQQWDGAASGMTSPRRGHLIRDLGAELSYLGKEVTPPPTPVRGTGGLSVHCAFGRSSSLVLTTVIVSVTQMGNSHAAI